MGRVIGRVLRKRIVVLPGGSLVGTQACVTNSAPCCPPGAPGAPGGGVVVQRLSLTVAAALLGPPLCHAAPADCCGRGSGSGGVGGGGVSVGCCPAAVPRTLYATLGAPASLTIALAWDGSRWASGAQVVCGQPALFLFLACSGGAWSLSSGLAVCALVSVASAPDAVTCAPFHLVFNAVAGTCCAGPFRVDVTE